MTKQIDNQGHQQLQDSAMQRQSPWQIIYNGYKSNSAILKDKYSPLLREEIISKQSKDPHALADIFKNIAEDNIGLARADDTNQSLKLYYYNDGAIACHHGLSVIEKANCNNDLGLQRLQELERKICGSLNDIQTEMVEMCRGKVELLQSISRKADLSNISKYGLLEQLRAETKKQLDDIEAAKEAKDDSAYIDLTAKAFKQVANGMGKYLEALYGEAERMLGPPPCDYTVIGLGSMALRQMTPYSDLEFAILTGNENYKQSADFTVREYFRNLTQLVHFKVINLGETIMPLSSYGFDFKDFIKTAVNFDLGGKTPLGRIDKPYELIQTVDGMINYLKNESDRTSHIDKTLLFILQKSCPIYQHGDKDLAKEYQSQANEFLLSLDKTNGRPYCENRAVQVLAKGGVEIDYTKQTPQEHKSVGNLKQFSFNFDDTVGRLFDVKQEIYRMPDRFIYNLGMIHGIQEESSWDTIDKLCDKGIINSEGAANLKKALSFATNLRLKTYSHYGYQKDTMDFAKTYEIELADVKSKEKLLGEELNTIFTLPREDLQEDGALFQYYYTALALRNSLEEYCKLDDTSQKEGFFNKSIFCHNNANTKAQINSRLLRYEDALKCHLEEVEGLKIKKQNLIGDNADITKIDLDIASSLNNIGGTCRFLSEHEKALNYYMQALATRQKSLDKDHPDIANSYNNIGSAYGSLDRYEEALNYLIPALAIRQKSLDKDHPDIANSYNNIGCTYGELGDHLKALDYKKKALEIFESLDKDHPDVANTLNNIGYSYGKLGDHRKALEYVEKALEILQKSLGEDHSDIARSYNNMGSSWGALGNHQEALEYHKKALEIWKKSPREDHNVVIGCKNSIAQAYGHLGMYNEALAELADIILVKYKTNQPDKILFYSEAKMAKDLYEGAHELLNQQKIAEGSKISTKVINNLKTALSQFRKCSNLIKSDAIDEKILQTLDLLIKEQKSTKNKLAIRKQLKEYQKEYDELKKFIDDKQLKLQEIEEYLAEQKQIRDAQSEVESAHNTLSTLETNSLFEAIPENTELVSLSGENHSEDIAPSLN